MPRQSTKEIKCTVNMLDGEEQHYVLPASDTGNDLLRRVADRLNIGPEIEYFGLWVPEVEPKKWIHVDDPLDEQLKRKKNTVVTFDFGVKFFVSNPSKLVSEHTRYLFFCQVKDDMSNGTFTCDNPNAALRMCAYAAQAMIGDFDPETHNRGYIATLLLHPHLTFEEESEIQRLHAAHQGMSQADAEYEYLRTAAEQTQYGNEFFGAVDGKKRNVQVGVGEIGIVCIDARKVKLNQYQWPEVVHILFSERKKTFSVVVASAEGQEPTKVTFKCHSSKSAEALWAAAVQRHTFFRRRRKPQEKQASKFKRALGLAKQSPLTISKVSGKTQHEVIRASIKRKNMSPSTPTNFRRQSGAYQYNSRATTPASAPPSAPPSAPASTSKPVFEIPEEEDKPSDAFDEWDNTITAPGTTEEATLATNVADDLPPPPLSPDSPADAEPVGLGHKSILGGQSPQGPPPTGPPRFVRPPPPKSTPPPKSLEVVALETTISEPHLRALFPSSCVTSEVTALTFETGEIFESKDRDANADWWEVTRFASVDTGYIPGSRVCLDSSSELARHGYQKVLQYAATAVRPRPVCLAGPIKDQVLDHILVNAPDQFRAPITHTSRRQGVDEIAGLDFSFVSQSRMEELTNNGFFVETVQYDTETYSTSYNAIIQASSTRDKCIMEVNDDSTVFRLIDAGIEPVLIVILPTSDRDSPSHQEPPKKEKKLERKLSLSEQIAQSRSERKIVVDENGDVLRSGAERESSTDGASSRASSRPLSMQEEMMEKLKRRSRSLVDDQGNIVANDEVITGGSSAIDLLKKRVADQDNKVIEENLISSDLTSGTNSEAVTRLKLLYGKIPAAIIYADSVEDAAPQVMNAISTAMQEPFWACETIRNLESDGSGLKNIILKRGPRGYGFTVSSIGHTVASITKGGIAEGHGEMSVGDRIVAVDRIPTTAMPYQELIATMKASTILELLLMSPTEPTDDDDLPMSPDAKKLDTSSMRARPAPPPKNRESIPATSTPAVNIAEVLTEPAEGSAPQPLPSPRASPRASPRLNRKIMDGVTTTESSTDIEEDDAIEKARREAREAANAFLSAPDALKSSTTPDSEATASPMSELSAQKTQNFESDDVDVLEVVIPREPGEDLGVSFESNVDGSFSVKNLPTGPAANSGLVQSGDRILEVNRQTVIGSSHDGLMKAIGLDSMMTTLKISRPKTEVNLPPNTVRVEQVDGRYGLSIRGGIDTQDTPTISSISPGSHAEETALRKEMQILRINNHPVANCTHDELLSLIKDSKGYINVTVADDLSAQKEDSMAEEEFTIRKKQTDIAAAKLQSMSELVEKYYGTVLTPPETIEFDRKIGESLGFSFTGGCDKPVLANDDNIYVSAIVKNGAADKDGRLKVGDRILTANGSSLNSVNHMTVAHILKSNKTSVSLVIVRAGEKFVSSDQTSGHANRPLSLVSQQGDRNQLHSDHHNIASRYHGALTATERIEYSRKPGESLGFSFSGGTDRPLVDGDSNVYITKIVAGGAAALDGRLKVGDRVLSANGTIFGLLDHSSIIRALKMNATGIKLEVCRPSDGATADLHVVTDAPEPVRVQPTNAPAPITAVSDEDILSDRVADVPQTVSQGREVLQNDFVEATSGSETVVQTQADTVTDKDFPAPTNTAQPIPPPVDKPMQIQKKPSLKKSKKSQILDLVKLFHGSPTVMERIEFSRKKGESLGFSFSGGADRAILPGDENVYVTIVTEGGAAFKDGRLKIGDRILRANGTALQGVSHDAVVHVLKSQPTKIVLEVCRPTSETISSSPASSPVAAINESMDRDRLASVNHREAIVENFQKAMSTTIKIQIEYSRKVGESLGFSFAGGTDKPITDGDNNIYVTNIIPGGTADKNGLLKIGDRILEANNTKFNNVRHIDVVSVLKSSPTHVKLVVDRPEHEETISTPEVPAFTRTAEPMSEPDSDPIEEQKFSSFEATPPRSTPIVQPEPVAQAILHQSPPKSPDNTTSPKSSKAKADARALLTQNFHGATTSTEIIEFTKQKSEGLGFSFAGGSDKPVSADDSSIYITSIKSGSVTERDGRLRIGDRLLEANGTKLDGVDHNSAIFALKSSPQRIRLVVCRPDNNNKIESGKDTTTPLKQSKLKPKNSKKQKLLELVSLFAVDGLVKEETIEFSRPAGASLGFSFAGGADKTVQDGDDNVYVTVIVEGSAADHDGRLKVGDRIVSANGVAFKGATHDRVVQALKSQSTFVSLIICRPISSTDSANGATPAPSTPNRPPVEATTSPSGTSRLLEEIEFAKGKGGLGLNLSGGTDQATSDGDVGIYITKIMPGGSADMDGRLAVGDKVIEANGTNLENVTHQQAVDVMRSNTAGARLKIERICTRIFVNPVNGKFGFGITGGTDTGATVIVSQIHPNSGAAQSGLQVGHEVMFIGGQSVRSLTHDQVMGLVQSAGTEGALEILILGDSEQSSFADHLSENSIAGQVLNGTVVKGDYSSIGIVFDGFEQDFHCGFGILDSNKSRNRYVDILAYDHTRVPLGPEEEYINANYIQYVDQGIRMDYIATQGPLEETAGDFWQMIWEQGVSVVCMMTALVEGRRKKCYKYWPDENQRAEFGSAIGTFLVENKKESDESGYTIRTLRLSCGEGEREIYHCHFEAWPDHGVPLEPGDFVRYLTHVENIKADMDELPPTALHCSAGIGRTGVFMLCETALALMQNGGCADMADIVTKFREQRMRIVQTEAQYDFCFETLEALRNGGYQPPTIIFGQA